MSATTLTVVLQGLLALVPNNQAGGTNQMTVLMLDGNHAHGMECVSGKKYEHKPRLRIRADNRACEEAGCDSDQGICSCEATDLKRKEIWLEIQPQPQPPLNQLPKNDPPRAIPTNRQEAAELGYVANMSLPPFNLSLNGQYLSASPPSNLWARLRFPFESIMSCALAKRFDGGGAFVHALGFRKLGALWQKDEASQAMAQMAIASVTIPDPGETGPKVILHLKSLDGQGEAMIPLDPSGPHGYVIDFSNNTAVLPVDDPCDDGVARHFSLFYELAENPPSMKDRLIPHIRLTQSTRAEELALEECEIPDLNAPLDRPICPLAMFSPSVKEK
jgi:hypothetical protein